jgi:hypothetical protein
MKVNIATVMSQADTISKDLHLAFWRAIDGSHLIHVEWSEKAFVALCSELGITVDPVEVKAAFNNIRSDLSEYHVDHGRPRNGDEF